MNATAAVAFPNPGIYFLKPSAFTKSNHGISLFSPKEITDGIPLFARPVLKTTAWSTRSEGNNRRGRPRKSTSSSGTDKDENPKESQSFDNDSNSANNEEILALFRRIQSSIAKEGPRATRNTTFDNSKKSKSADTALDVLPQSRNQIDDAEKEKVLPQLRGSYKKERTIEDNSPLDFKPTRPPSAFVKKSPIQKLSTPKEEVDDVATEGTPPAVNEETIDLQIVDVMKLPELKELAKSRGVKGYSRLKKAELVELLKEVLRS